MFASQRFDAVIHFAGLKAVGESVANPLTYYSNNMRATIVLLEAMVEFGVKNIIFSSSCTVYGNPQHVPIAESHPGQPSSPYGRTKRNIEIMLEDIAKSDPSWRIASLRYFNPVGCHPSGEIGEHPPGVPQNLMPYIERVALEKLPKVSFMSPILVFLYQQLLIPN